MATIIGRYEKQARRLGIVFYEARGLWGRALLPGKRTPPSKNPGTHFSFVYPDCRTLSIGYYKGPGRREAMFKYMIKHFKDI